MANKGESRKGQITSARAINDNNGQHATYVNNRNETMYKFYLTWDNGDQGEASAKSPNKQYKLNTDLTYVKYVREHNGNYYQSFSTINDPTYKSQGGGGGGSTKPKTPEEQKIIINQVALIAYNSVMNKLREPGNECYSAFKGWMYNKIFNLNEDPMTTQGVFKIACENVGNGMENSTIADVLTRADGFLSTVKNIEWNNPTQSHQQSNSQQSGQQQPPPQQSQPNQPPVEEPHHEEPPPEQSPPSGPFTI